MKLFQKLVAAPAIISIATGFAVNAAEINSTDLSDYSNSNNPSHRKVTQPVFFIGQNMTTRIVVKCCLIER